MFLFGRSFKNICESISILVVHSGFRAFDDMQFYYSVSAVSSQFVSMCIHYKSLTFVTRQTKYCYFEQQWKSLLVKHFTGRAARDWKNRTCLEMDTGGRFGKRHFTKVTLRKLSNVIINFSSLLMFSTKETIVPARRCQKAFVFERKSRTDFFPFVIITRLTNIEKARSSRKV